MNKAFVLPRRRTRIRPYLDFTAMIDTVFNLLIFFAVISTFAGNGGKHGIQMDLPKATTTQPVIDRVVLALAPGHLPQVNGRQVSMQGIGTALNDVTRGERETQVVVMADKGVVYATLVAALDRVREAGYHRIALAAAPAAQLTAQGQHPPARPRG